MAQCKIKDPINRCTPGHKWEFRGNFPGITVVMVIYHYVDKIWRIIIHPDFLYNIYNNENILYG